MTRDRYLAAPRFEEYLGSVEKNRDMWRSLAHRARVGEDVLERVRQLPPLRLLALSEDWCGDAINTLPIIARMAEEVPHLDFRVIGRDDNPDLMDAHLTGGSRSIPVVIVYDEAFRELGHWGPRPTELQSWVLDTGLGMPSKERYREVRRWYAKDRGRTTAQEVLDKIRTAIRQRPDRLLDGTALPTYRTRKTALLKLNRPLRASAQSKWNTPSAPTASDE